MVAFRVNSKSAHVMGVPSAHTACGLIRYFTVNGFWVRPPLATLGYSVVSGEFVNLPSRVSCVALGMTYWMTDQYSQEAEAHWVSTLMHSGYCSAPRTILPPWIT